MVTLLVPAADPPPAGAGEALGQRYVDPVFEVGEPTTYQYGENTPLAGGPGPELHLDLYEPAGDTVARRPVVVLAHGGGFCGGSRTSPHIVELSRAMAARGWLAASITYRYDDTKCDDVPSITASIQDAAAAVRWFRANADAVGADPTRISAMGYSAGAFVAVGLAYGNTNTSSGNPGWPSHVAAAVSLAGASFGKPPTVDPPVQIVHGDADTRVPFVWGTDTCDHVRSVGGRCELVVHEGVGHGVIAEPSVVPDAASFLRRCAASYGGFPDVPNAEGDLDAAVGWMAEWAITTGYADGRFHPENGMNRQQIAAFLHRLAGEPEPGEGGGFPDVPEGSPFATAIAWLASTGITEGYGDGTFRPTNPVTRQQIAAFLWRALGEPEAPDDAPSFPDVPAEHPFVDAISWLASTGITEGYGDGTFRPDDPVTRLSAAIFLWRLGRLDAAWDGPMARPEAACSNIDLTR